MYPAQCDEIVLVLYEEEFLFVFCVAIVRPTALFRYDDMSNCERISGLENTTKFNVRDSILAMCLTAFLTELNWEMEVRHSNDAPVSFNTNKCVALMHFLKNEQGISFIN